MNFKERLVKRNMGSINEIVLFETDDKLPCSWNSWRETKLCLKMVANVLVTVNW